MSYLKDKVFGNVDFIINNAGEYIQNFLKHDNLIINGQAYKNLKYYFGQNGIFSYNELYDLFKEDKCSVIHGDFTIDNIIYDESLTEKVHLIDPNVNNIHETCNLDFAKMLQSLHGNYEYYNCANKLEIGNNYINYILDDTENYKKLYERYDQYLLNNFNKKVYKSIYTHEIIHWLRLMPYKINKNPKTATLYFAQLIIILSDYEKKFKGENCEN